MGIVCDWKLMEHVFTRSVSVSCGFRVLAAVFGMIVESIVVVTYYFMMNFRYFDFLFHLPPMFCL